MEWGHVEDCVGRDARHRILGVFTQIFSRSKVFYKQGHTENKAREPGILMETASVAVGSCCHLLGCHQKNLGYLMTLITFQFTPSLLSQMMTFDKSD